MLSPNKTVAFGKILRGRNVGATVFAKLEETVSSTIVLFLVLLSKIFVAIHLYGPASEEWVSAINKAPEGRGTYL